MDIESHEYGACLFDYIEISFDNSFKWKYCGDGSCMPKQFVTSGSSMTIKFITDIQNNKPGFFARWEEINGRNPFPPPLLLLQGLFHRCVEPLYYFN